MQKLHLIVGALGFLLFLATGLYMYFGLEQLSNVQDGQKMLYRSSHIYILLTSFLNIMIGLSYTIQYDKTKRMLQNIASIIFLIVPFILFPSFFIEGANIDFDRPLTKLSVFLLLIAVVISIISKVLKPKNQ